MPCLQLPTSPCTVNAHSSISPRLRPFQILASTADEYLGQSRFLGTRIFSLCLFTVLMFILFLFASVLVEHLGGVLVGHIPPIMVMSALFDIVWQAKQ